MAKLEKNLTGNFDTILKRIENSILSGSVSATLEDVSDFKDQNSRCSAGVIVEFLYINKTKNIEKQTILL